MADRRGDHTDEVLGSVRELLRGQRWLEQLVASLARGKRAVACSGEDSETVAQAAGEGAEEKLVGGGESLSRMPSSRWVSRRLTSTPDIVAAWEVGSLGIGEWMLQGGGESIGTQVWLERAETDSATVIQIFKIVRIMRLSAVIWMRNIGAANRCFAAFQSALAQMAPGFTRASPVNDNEKVFNVEPGPRMQMRQQVGGKLKQTRPQTVKDLAASDAIPLPLRHLIQRLSGPGPRRRCRRTGCAEAQGATLFEVVLQNADALMPILTRKGLPGQIALARAGRLEMAAARCLRRTSKGLRCAPRLRRWGQRAFARMALAWAAGGSLEASCRLPGGEQRAGERPDKCAQRLLEGKLGALADNIEMVGVQRQGGDDNSRTFGAPTRRARAVVSAEWPVHDDVVAHRLQLQVLQRCLAACRASGRRLVLSLEMFESDVQRVLDEYVLQRAIREQDMTQDSRPWPNYARDYRPLVELCREHGVRVIAANAPRRYVSLV
ncbi:unnamed protein product, partial [Prorocentrum cordatum]